MVFHAFSPLYIIPPVSQNPSSSCNEIYVMLEAVCPALDYMIEVGYWAFGLA